MASVTKIITCGVKPLGVGTTGVPDAIGEPNAAVVDCLGLSDPERSCPCSITGPVAERRSVLCGPCSALCGPSPPTWRRHHRDCLSTGQTSLRGNCLHVVYFQREVIHLSERSGLWRQHNTCTHAQLASIRTRARACRAFFRHHRWATAVLEKDSRDKQQEK
eukprot:4701419-Amphidinium_carterae.1